jgi:hypothetical protein
VEVFQFDRRERNISLFGSRGLRATRVAAGEGQVSVTCLNLAAGGLVGTHPASATQFFLVISGTGWVAGSNGLPAPVGAGWGVRWEEGEEHTSGTDEGMVALVIEGAPLELFAPEVLSGD